jgi:hypothetical protein
MLNINRRFSTTTANWPKFSNSYPATSAWTTAVGATQWPRGGGEIPATLENGALITSGGGFSAIVGIQSWQQSAITTFFSRASNLPISTSYNSASTCSS